MIAILLLVLISVGCVISLFLFFKINKNWGSDNLPITPDLCSEGIIVNGKLIYDAWICPVCGTYHVYDEFDYTQACPVCGQRIDWENVIEQMDEKLHYEY